MFPNFRFFTQVVDLSIVELSPIVQYKRMQNPKPTDDVLPVKFISDGLSDFSRSLASTHLVK